MNIIVYVVLTCIGKSLLVFVNEIEVEVDCFDRGWCMVYGKGKGNAR